MNRDSFERLYAEYAAPVYSFLAYRTGNPAVAEDLLADTFERVWASRGRFDVRRGSKKTWLYSIALNRLRDHARREVVESRALSELAQQEGEHANGSANGLERAELRQVLLAAMSGLDDLEREVLALRYGGDLSLREIAGLLGVPRSTVEGRLYRGLKKLSQELSEHEQAAVGNPAARS
jgi:RNA polymerase sigma factor (sigma-70 family)